ncbi:XisI protein [Spirosoma aureum]|uniref:XisI protein n=1 Tax=Spirosoma aureum TaxID=2692134 RepID=A0A6G9AQ62_9BACT|nr:XisI protein [Spirosoma aureum]QIP14353.1 XisI protein [Spirosoma aureum]
MDRLKKHKAIVRQIIEEIGRMTPSDEQSETQVIMDEERGHYLLFSIGWGHNRREYVPFVHLDVKPDAKVYIQHDGTDLKIANRLVEEGIEKQYIVLAFQSPNRRKLIPDFALS